MNNNGNKNGKNGNGAYTKSDFVDLTYFYTTKSGNLRSVPVDAATFDALQNIKMGARLFIEIVKTKRSDKTPDARLKLIVEEAAASNGASKARRPAASSSADI